jgi:hypothetical protein
MKALFAKTLKGDARSANTLVNLLRSLDLVANTENPLNTDEDEKRHRKELEEGFRRLTVEERQTLMDLNLKVRGETAESYRMKLG